MYGVFYGVCRARCPCRHVYMSEGLGTPECEFWFQRKLLKSAQPSRPSIAVGRRSLSRDPRDDACALARLGVMAWNGDLNELLATAWHFDQRVRCTAGHIVGVLTRLANDTGPDPLADNKSKSLRSRISGGTKWLGLRSKSKSPKFDADRKQFFPDDE